MANHEAIDPAHAVYPHVVDDLSPREVPPYAGDTASYWDTRLGTYVGVVSAADAPEELVDRWADSIYPYLQRPDVYGSAENFRRSSALLEGKVHIAFREDDPRDPLSFSVQGPDSVRDLISLTEFGLVHNREGLAPPRVAVAAGALVMHLFAERGAEIGPTVAPTSLEVRMYEGDTRSPEFMKLELGLRKRRDVASDGSVYGAQQIRVEEFVESNFGLEAPRQ